MSTFYDSLYAAIARQIVAIWPDVTAVLPVPQLQRYNWSNLITSGQMTLPVAVVKFGPMSPNNEYTVVNRVFDCPVSIFYVFSAPAAGLDDQATIYSKLIALDMNLQGGGIQDAVPEVVSVEGGIDGTERNELAAQFLLHNYDLSAGELKIVIRTGYKMNPVA